MEDKTKIIYDALSKTYNLGSYDEFYKKMGDENIRKKVYDSASKKYNLGNYDDFSSKLGYGNKPSTFDAGHGIIGKVDEYGDTSYVHPGGVATSELPAAVTQNNTPSAETPSNYVEQPKAQPVTANIWENIGTGFKSDWQQGKIFAGNIANIFTGSQKDATKALQLFNDYQKEGVDLKNMNSEELYNYQRNKEQSEADKKWEEENKEWEQRHPGTFDRLIHMLPLVDDRQPKIPKDYADKDPLSDFWKGDLSAGVIGEARDKAPYKLLYEAMKTDNPRAYLEEKAKQQSWGDKTQTEAEQSIASYPAPKGIGGTVCRAIPGIVPFVAAVVAGATPATRWAAKPLANIGLGTIGITSAGEAMEQAKQYAEKTGKDIPDSEILKVGFITGVVNEALMGLPVGRFMSGAAKLIGKNVGGKVAEELLTNPQALQEYETFMKKAAQDIPHLKVFTKEGMKKFGKDVSIGAGVGATINVSNDLIPMLYENREDYPKFWNVVKNGLEGAASGVVISAILGGESALVNNYAQNIRRMKQGNVVLADAGKHGIVEVTGQGDNYYTILNKQGEMINIPKSDINMDAVHEVPYKLFKDYARSSDGEYSSAFTNLQKGEAAIISENYFNASDVLDEALKGSDITFDKDKILNSSKEEQTQILNLAINDKNLTNEQKSAIVNFVKQGNLYNEMQRSFNTYVEDAAEGAINTIKKNVNPDMGGVVRAKIHGEDRIITKGKIVKNEDGSINKEQSDSEVYYRDENGNIQVSPTDNIEEHEFIPQEDAINEAVSIKTKPLIDQQTEDEGLNNPYSEYTNEQLNSILLDIEKTVKAYGEMTNEQRMNLYDEADKIESELNRRKSILTNSKQNESQPTEESSQMSENTVDSQQLVASNTDNLTTEQTAGNTEETPFVPRKFKIDEEVNAIENEDGTYSLDKTYSQPEAEKTVKKLNEDYSGGGITFDIQQLPKEDPTNPFEKPRWGITAKVEGEQKPESVQPVINKLSEQQATELISTMEQNAVDAPILELTPENWEKEFGESGIVKTPIGEAKMGDNQYRKIIQNGREKEFGMIKPTLENPDVIIEVPSEAKGGKNTERPSSYLFVKTFNYGGETIKFFTSVTVSKDGLEVVISNHIENLPRMRGYIKNGNLLYQRPDMVPGAETSNPVSTGQITEANNVGASSDKGTTNESDLQTSDTKKFVSEHNGQPLTRVEGLGMGQNQAKGTYVSFEPKNRYETENNKAKPVEISLQNPIEFDQNKDEFSAFQQQTLIDRYDDFKVSDFSYLNEGEVPTIDNLNENGINRLAGFVTERLQRNGYDGIVFSGEGEHEIVVFDGNNVREKQPEPAKKPVRQKRQITTPFQKRLDEVKNKIESLKDSDLSNEKAIENDILYGIATGDYKFRWKDKGSVNSKGKGTSVGTARELGYNGKDGERKARIGILSNDGYTPNTLAHKLWQDSNGAMDDGEIRNKVIDILNSVNSRKQALEQLEANAGTSEEEYLRQLEEEAALFQDEINNELQLEDNRVDEFENDIPDVLAILREHNEINFKDFSNFDELLQYVDGVLVNHFALTDKDIADIKQSINNAKNRNESHEDHVNRISEKERSRPLLEISEERTPDRGNNEGESGSVENGSDGNIEGRTRQEVPELTPLQQKYVQEQTAAYDERIEAARKDYESAKTKFEQQQKKYNQANVLFREETEQRNLFGDEGLTNVSKGNADRILAKYQPEVEKTKAEYDRLVNERPKAIEQINRDAIAQKEITEQPEKSIHEQLSDVGGDVLAHAKNVVKKTEIKSEEEKVNTTPTEAQKEAGNYQKGHVNVQGFDISIENPKGSVRSGVDENGNEWNQEMKNTYGYIRGTEGKDGDHIDVFLGDNLTSDKVFVIDQVNPNTGAFDEHKAMIGFNSAEEARSAYLSNFEDGWKGFGAITETNVNDFGKWAEMDGRRIKPFSEYKGNIPEKPTYDGKDVLDFAAKVNDWNEKYLTGNEKLANQKDYDFDVSGITDANAQEMKAIKEKAKADGTFMKAPNGKDTNLNERDWLQVRTEGFKKFFGDWELANKLQMIEDLAAIGIKPHTYTREQLQQIYRDIENGKNKLDNRVVEFSHGVFGKMLRFGTDGNFAKIIPQLREVFNNSIPIYSESEQPTEGHKQHPNLVGFHNYLGKVKFGGNDYYVRFTVQEHRETTKNKGKRNPNELHNAFVSDVEIYNKTDVSEITDPRTTGRVTKTPVFVDAKLQQFFEKAREARENSSKVVDENGEPKPVTHSTNKEFTVFKNKQENDSGWLGAGYYFFGDRSLDGQYGENVMETFLNIKNPYYAAYKEAKRLSELNDRQASQEFTDELIGEGYDGVYFDGNLNQEWVAFSPNQIKSATDNSGNFDINNNDIQFHSEQKNAFTPITIRQLDALTNPMIEKGILDEVVTDKTEYNKALKEAKERQHLTFSDGDTYGFVQGRKMYIDTDKLNLNTPIHEGGHLYWPMMPEKMRSEIIELLKKTDGWKTLTDKPAYANLKTDYQKGNELFNRILGDYGEKSQRVQEIIGKDITLFARVRNAINEFLNWLKAKFRNTDAKLNEFAKQTLGELLNGKKINENLESESKINTFAENNLVNNERTETGLDNRTSMERSTENGLVGRSEKGSGIYRTISAANNAGDRISILPIEEREELESRGINPDWDRVQFRSELKREAIQNGVWLDKSYLDDKKLVHDQAKAATTENDVYINPDGKTLTKLNNLSQVKGSNHKANLLALIDRLNSHNELFPNVLYTIKGFMENKSGFPSLVLEQPFIDAERNATQNEIDKYLIDKGFRLEGKTLKYWTNGKYIIEDARPANVLKGKDGNLYFIDTIPHSVEYLNNNSSEPRSGDVMFQVVPNEPKAPDNEKPVQREGEGIIEFARRVAEWSRKQEENEKSEIEDILPDNFIKMEDYIRKSKMPTMDEGESHPDYLKRLREWKKQRNPKLNLDTAEKTKKERSLAEKLIHGAKVTAGFEVPENRAILRPIKNAIIDRRMELNKANYETSLFTHLLRANLSKPEREAIPFIIEGKGLPESIRENRPDIASVFDNPSEDVKKSVLEIRERFDDMWDKIRSSTDDELIGYHHDYVTHMWDFDKSAPEAVRQFNATRNRYLNKRVIESLNSGIEAGLVPKTMDVADIIQRYETHLHDVIENNKLINTLRGIKNDGFPILIDKDLAPNRFVTINNDALKNYRVDPDVRSAIQAVFGQNRIADNSKLLEMGWRGWEAIGGLMKKTQLSLSLFHHGALTETSIASSGILKTLKATGKMFSKTPMAFQNPELSRDAVSHGVKLGATSDIPVAEIRNVTARIRKFMKDNNIPVAKEIAAVLDNANNAWDKVLWDYIHDGFKLYGYETMAAKVRERAIKDEIDNATLEKQLREVGQLINDVYGGQNWDVLGVSPMETRVLRSLLLSPDWTISTVRQALAPTGFGSLYNDDAFWKRTFKGDSVVNARKRFGNEFWIKAAIYFGLSMNALNMALRWWDKKKEDEEAEREGRKSYYSGDAELNSWIDYTMLGNAIGKKTFLFTGRYADGSERYLRWGKQFRELPELLYDDSGFSFPKPMLKKIGGKANPLLNLIFGETLAGNSLSGFENRDLSNAKGWGYSEALLGTVLKSFLPFDVQSIRDDKEFTLTDLIMPSGKGMTKSGAIRLFGKGLENKDIDYIRDVYVGAKRNGLDAYDLFKTALQVSKSQDTKNILKGLDTIEKLEKALQEAKDNKNYKTADKYRRKLNTLKKKAFNNDNKEFKNILDDLEKEDFLDDKKP